MRRGPGGATLAGLRIAVPVALRILLAALRAELRAGTVVELGAAAPSEGGAPGSGSADEALYVSRAVFTWVEDEILRTLAAHHKSAPRSEGLPRESLRLQLGPLGAGGKARTPTGKAVAAGAAKTRPSAAAGLGEGPKVLAPPRLLQAVVESLAKTGRLLSERELLRLPTHRVVSGDAERALAERVAGIYLNAGLGPPRLEEIPPLLASQGPSPRPPPPAASALKAALDALVRVGTLVRIKDLLFHREPLLELRARLIAFLKEHHELNPTQWKDLCGQSRKFTIPLAEHFDAEKLTLRVGDLRRLRAGPNFSA